MSDTNLANNQHHEWTDAERRILAAAEKEFLEKGFAGARTTAIAREAGVSHPTVHYYFRTKEQLFSTVMSAKISEVAKTFVIPFVDDDTPLEQCISQIVSAHFDFVLANPGLPKFMFSEVLGNPELLAQLGSELQCIASTVIEPLQRKINHACRELQGVSALQLMIDIISLNIMAVVAIPVFEKVAAPLSGMTLDEFIAERRRSNILTIQRKLKI